MVEGLAEAVTEALNAIDPLGDLSGETRRQLDVSVGDLLTPEQMRSYNWRLQLMCARKTKPVWDFLYEDDAIFQVAEATSPTSADHTSIDLGSLRAALDERLLQGEDCFPAGYAGLAAWAVIRDAVQWERVPLGVAAPSELEIEPDEWSGCFYSSLAASGGATWEEVGDSDRRRDFWEWYVTEAVPMAFRVASVVGA